MYIAAVLLELLLISVDQLTKRLAVHALKDNAPVGVINGVLELRYVENQGAAFGIMQGFRWFFVALTVPLLAGMVYYFLKLPKTRYYHRLRFALVLVSAGAFGNFIDRLRNGYVVDFFHALFINFPVFNMADIFVVVGTILMVVLLLLPGEPEEIDDGKAELDD